ncbi:glucokinase [Gemmatimonadetes bacterium T265]|nr:glucokinase [Gemmatimonadetes bacterium T265]
MPNVSRAVGLDLGGTQVRAALVDDGGAVLARAAAPTDVGGGPSAVLAQFDALVAAVLRGARVATVDRVGIASPGPLDTEAGVVLGIPTLPGWRGFPLRAALAERFGRPVVVENDAIAAAYGEWRFGAGRGLRHVVYVTVSTGIGGGVVIDGRLVHGRLGMATHVGHIRLVEGGPACSCGAFGCFEALASGTALAREARAAAATSDRTGPVTAEDVVRLAREGDPAARVLLDAEARWLGVGFASLIHLFSPERVVMGGGVSRAFDLLEGGVHAVIERTVMPPFRGVRVVRAELDGDSGLVGAAALALDQRAADRGDTLDMRTP